MLSIHCSTSMIDPLKIECALVSQRHEESFKFEAKNVSANPVSFDDSGIIYHYSLQSVSNLLNTSLYLKFKYGINAEWICIDTQYINEERLIFEDVYIGRKAAEKFDTTIANFNEFIYIIEGNADTLFIRK